MAAGPVTARQHQSDLVHERTQGVGENAQERHAPLSHGENPAQLGIPLEEELTAQYCRVSGRSELPHWRYFIVFALFRSASIRAGVYKRAFDGTAASAQAFEAGQRYRGTAACAWRLADR